MLLETQRLILRNLQEEDFDDYFCAYFMDTDMDRMMGRSPSPDVETARLNFNWLMNKEERAYALICKETGKVIGNLTIYNAPPLSVADLPEQKGKTGRALSFALSRQHQRKGLMEEALRAVISYLFEVENVDYINCGCFDFNHASLTLQVKLGFAHLITESFEPDGKAVTGIENILRNPQQ